MRSDRHYLPVHEIRCSSDTCERRYDCVRRLAVVEQGSPVGDLQVIAQARGWPIFGCTDFVRVGFFKRPEVQAKARVHPPLGG